MADENNPHLLPTELAMQTQSLKEHGVYLLQPVGEIGSRNFEVIESALQDLISRGNHRIIVDLQQVTYMSSAGVGVLIGVLMDVRDKKGDMVLMRPAPDVGSVLKLLNVTALIKVFDDIPASLAYFKTLQ